MNFDPQKHKYTTHKSCSSTGCVICGRPERNHVVPAERATPPDTISKPVPIVGVSEDLIIGIARLTMDAELAYDRQLTDAQRGIFASRNDFVEKWLSRYFVAVPPSAVLCRNGVGVPDIGEYVNL